MPVGYRAPAGGLPSAARALLTPENIRAGVHIKGGGVDVIGTNTMALKVQAVKNIAWNSTQSNTATATHTVARACHYMISVSNSCRPEYLESSSGSASGTRSSADSNVGCGLYTGEAAAGETIRGTCSGRTTRSDGTLRVMIYTDE